MCSVASVLSDSANLWTVALQGPQYMGFSRQEYWRRLPCPPPGGSSLLQGIFPPPGDLPDSGIEPESLTSPALAGRVFTTDHLGGLFGPLTDLISSPVPSLPGALESGLWELLVPSVFLQLQIFISVISPWPLVPFHVIFPVSYICLSCLSSFPKQSAFHSLTCFIVLSLVYLYHFKSHFA